MELQLQPQPQSTPSNDTCHREGKFYELVAHIAALQTEVRILKLRCDVKEERLRILEKWQNRAIGYAAMATLMINLVYKNLPDIVEVLK